MSKKRFRFASDKRTILSCAVAAALIAPFNHSLPSRLNLIIYGFLIIGLLGLTIRNLKNSLDTNLTITLAVLIFWVVISGLWAPSKVSAFNASYVYGLAVLVFLILLNCFNEPRFARYWLWLYLIIAAGCASMGLA